MEAKHIARALLFTPDPRLTLQVAASLLTIERVETTASVTFSGEYTDFLLQTNGVWVGGDALLGVPPVEAALDGLQTRELFLQDWPPGAGWWPVASDGLGNYYVLMTRPPDGVGGAPVGFVETGTSLSKIHSVVASSYWAFVFFISLNTCGPSTGGRCGKD